MNREQTFAETIDQILSEMPEPDPDTTACLRWAMVVGALLAERRMSLSLASAAALRRELEALSVEIAIRRLDPEA